MGLGFLALCMGFMGSLVSGLRILGFCAWFGVFGRRPTCPLGSVSERPGRFGFLMNTQFESHLAKCSGGLPLALFGAYLWTSCAGDLLPADSRQNMFDASEALRVQGFKY